MISTALLGRLRVAGAQRTYEDRMVIKGRVQATPGRTGGRTTNYEVRESDVPCRLAPDFQPVREQRVGAVVQDIAYATVYCSPTVEIRATDQLEIQPNDEETTPIVINVTRSELRRTKDLERMTRGIVIGGRGTVTP